MTVTILNSDSAFQSIGLSFNIQTAQLLRKIDVSFVCTLLIVENLASQILSTVESSRANTK